MTVDIWRMHPNLRKRMSGLSEEFEEGFDDEGCSALVFKASTSSVV